MTEFFSDRETFEATIRHMLESGVSGSFGRIHLVNVLSSPDGNAQVIPAVETVDSRYGACAR